MLVRLDESGSGGFDDFEGARIAVIKLADQVFHFRIFRLLFRIENEIGRNGKLAYQSKQYLVTWLFALVFYAI